MTDSNTGGDADGDSPSADATGTDAIDSERDADAAVEQAREQVIEAMARAGELYGLKSSYGRLYGVLYFAEEPLSLDELVERSDYAKSTVSTAMTAMERYHFVHRRSIPGEGKKAYFEAERDFWHVFQQLLNGEVRSEIRIMTRALDDAAETLREIDAERADADLRKVEKLQRIYERSETAIDVLTSASFDSVVNVIQRLRSRE